MKTVQNVHSVEENDQKDKSASNDNADWGENICDMLSVTFSPHLQ